MSLAAALTPELEAQLAREFGLDEMPAPRYDDLPTPAMNPEDVSRGINFVKAVQLVDSILSAAVMRYAPPTLFVDQSMDARVFCRQYSHSVLVPKHRPIPVNRKITAATGIGYHNTLENRSIWAWTEIRWVYDQLGANAISPVLAFEVTQGPRRERFMGVIFKVGIRKIDGRRLEDGFASVGLLHPKYEPTSEGTREIRADNEVTPFGGSD